MPILISHTSRSQARVFSTIACTVPRTISQILSFWKLSNDPLRICSNGSLRTICQMLHDLFESGPGTSEVCSYVVMPFTDVNSRERGGSEWSISHPYKVNSCCLHAWKYFKKNSSEVQYPLDNKMPTFVDALTTLLTAQSPQKS